jgi:arylformamidase
MAHREFRHITVATLLLLLAGCPGQGDIVYEDIQVFRDIPYASIGGVDANLLSLDIYVPDPAPVEPMPVVVWVHGGAWRTGDKSNQMQHKPPLFSGAGYCLVSVNYRLSPDPPDGDPGRIIYPMHELDVAAAIAWVQTNIASYGGDPDRMALMGHSAGAHLVSLVSTDELFLAPHTVQLSAIKGVIALDTGGYDIPQNLIFGPAALYENAFGDDPAVWAEASPITHVESGKDIAPFFLVTRGAAFRQQLCVDFAAALDDISVESTVLDASPYTHADVNAAVGFPGETVVTPPLMAFLAQVFQPPSP